MNSAAEQRGDLAGVNDAELSISKGGVGACGVKAHRSFISEAYLTPLPDTTVWVGA